MNILFISTEAAPFAKSGGLGDVIGSLPAALNKLGADARVMMPLYKNIKEQYGDSLEFLTSLTAPLAWRREYCGIYRMEYAGVIFYFLDNERYFKRDKYYGYYDDGERFAFFSQASLECLSALDFQPQVLHCSEWHTALVPVFLKVLYQERDLYRDLRTVFTIHNIEYQGQYGHEMLSDLLGLPFWAAGILDLDKDINFMKGAVVTCDKLTTVSPSYAEEITYPFYAHGLENIIKENEYKLAGIINGIDQRLYSPALDKNLAVRYSRREPEKKALNKTALQEELGMTVDGEIPLVGMVTRMAVHKGLDLVERAFDEMMEAPLQFVILGSGESRYEEFFRKKALEYPGRMGVSIGFSGTLASRIYGGADFFLMPSISEPCGLAQMMALRYGTIPVVRETGGLRDTVIPFNPRTGKGNGVTFASVNAHDMLGAIRRGLDLYGDKKLWARLRENAFKSDFSWRKSAREYMNIYNSLLP